MFSWNYIQVLSKSSYPIIPRPIILNFTVTEENIKRRQDQFLKMHILRQLGLRFVIVEKELREPINIHKIPCCGSFIIMKCPEDAFLFRLK